MLCVARTCCSPSRRGNQVRTGGSSPFQKTLDKCSVIVNLVPVNREMPKKPDKFSLPSMEVLALLAHVAR